MQLNITALEAGLNPLLPYPQWIAWKGTPLANGKTQKLLINPHTGRAASSTDSTTWGTFEQVQKFIAGSEYGVGFVFTKNDPFFFIDVDNKHPHNDEWCQTLRLSFPDAFIETSQSGNGIHIVGIGAKPEGFRCKTDHDWDIYVHGRFCALTGFDTSGDAGKYDHSAVLDSLTRQYLDAETGKVEWTCEPPEDYTFTGADEELIEKALKGESSRARFGGTASFKDIWNRTDALITHFPNDQRPDECDESRVESALCTHLAFWTGRNAERIERIVTDLYPHVREKWENRPKYREETIRRALGVSTEYYSKRNDAVTAMLTPFQVPTAATTTPKWTEGVVHGGDYGKDHSASACTFLSEWYDMGNQLIRIDEDFFRYNGKVWEQTGKEALTGELMKAMAACSPQTSWIDGAYKIVQYMSIRADGIWGKWGERDTSSVIVYQNGILDITTDEFLPHDPEFYTTNIMPYEYDPNATCDQWLQFLWGVFEGDAERVALLQEWLGYMLVRDYSYQKMMLLIGLRRSGKGTIGRIMELLVGPENFTGVGLEDLATDENLNSLRNKTVGFDGDAHTVSKANQGLVLTRAKKLSGNDSINFNRKYKSSASIRLPTRLTIAANNMLSFIDDSGAMAGRLLVLPFNKSWFGQEDIHLGGKLESEISGIANWAIEGLRRLRANNKFTEPAISMEEIEALRQSYSPLTQFADDMLEFGSGKECTSGQVFQAFQMWCRSQGRNSGTQAMLTRTLKDTYRGQIHAAQVRCSLSNTTQRGFRGIGFKVAKLEGVKHG